MSAAAFPRRRNLDAIVRALAAEFRGRFDIGTVRSRDGVSLAADPPQARRAGPVRRSSPTDADEMRDALREDAEDFPPGSQAQPGGDQRGGPDG